MGNYKGKNVDEAIENGLSELNLKKVKSKSILLIMEMLEFLVFLKKKLRLKSHH